jgi:hypothetical protein
MVWAIFRRRHEATEGQPAQEPPVRHLQKSAGSDKDELLAAIQIFRCAANTAAANEAQKHKSGLSDARATIARARKWVRESGVGAAACALYEASRPWSAWSKRDDWAKWNQLCVSDVDGNSGKSVAFTWRERRWQFTHEQHQFHLPGDNCNRGNLTVNVDGSDVLALAVSKDYEEFSRWEPADVSALTVGDWAAALVEMHVVLEHARKTRLSEAEAERLQQQAGKITF